MKSIILSILFAITQFICFLKSGYSELPNSRVPLLAENITIGEPLKSRIDLTVKRLLSDQPFAFPFVIQDVARNDNNTRLFEDWEGDISGRFLSAFSLLARVTNERYPKLDSVAGEVLKCQHDDGHFGKNLETGEKPNWGAMIWGHGRLLTGLVEYARLTNDPGSVQSADKLGSYISESISRWDVKNKNEMGFTSFTQTIEALMKLYFLTGDEKILEAGKRIVSIMPQFGYHHSHGYLLTLYGLGQLYLATGKPEYLKQLEDTYWRDIMRRGYIADGSVPELFPLDFRSEGCSIVDWMRLNLLMWTITGETVYLDQAERTLYNALFFNQSHNGIFGSPWYSFTGYGDKFSEAWWCCIFHGLYGMIEFSQYLVTADQEGLSVNFYLPSSIIHNIHGKKVTIITSTSYPAQGDISLRIQSNSPVLFPLRIRVPRWTTVKSIKINGTSIPVSVQNGYTTLSRLWNDGDVISFSLPLQIRIENNAGEDMLRDWHRWESLRSLNLKNAVFCYGPLILCADKKYSPLMADIVIPSVKEIIPIPENYNKVFSSSPFYIPQAHFLIDKKYSGGEQDVLLTPLSEQTGHFPYSEIVENFSPSKEIPISRYPVQFLFDVTLLPAKKR